ncbi:MAG: hypothetical protein JST30_10480 [Armatimonadetes bacterium]|nr:hypothetical protein [Armatimonadota bacterium]
MAIATALGSFAFIGRQAEQAISHLHQTQDQLKASKQQLEESRQKLRALQLQLEDWDRRASWSKYKAEQFGRTAEAFNLLARQDLNQVGTVLSRFSNKRDITGDEAKALVKDAADVWGRLSGINDDNNDGANRWVLETTADLDLSPVHRQQALAALNAANVDRRLLTACNLIYDAQERQIRWKPHPDRSADEFVPRGFFAHVLARSDYPLAKPGVDVADFSRAAEDLGPRAKVEVGDFVMTEGWWVFLYVGTIDGKPHGVGLCPLGVVGVVLDLDGRNNIKTVFRLRR